MKLSVVIPIYNANNIIADLISSLRKQTFSNFEVIFVDDCSTDNTVPFIKRLLNDKNYFNHKVISSPHNRGPAHCRNLGAEAAKGDVIVFTDSDCMVEQNWLENIHTYFSTHDKETPKHKDILTYQPADAIMGKLILKPSTRLGNAISALGFPAGGSIGFEQIWPVDDCGCTTSLSTCNCAILKRVFKDIGGFDTSFPFPGGEDSLLAYQLLEKGYQIQYRPELRVHHAARDSFKGFIRWQFRRGISSYIFSKKIEKKRNFFSLRVWSTRNIIRTAYQNNHLPLVLLLFILSFLIQSTGFISRKYVRE